MANMIPDKVFFKIIVPNYNNMAYIKQCLDSIVNQSFKDFVVVIIDDMSTDMSDKVCEMYARKHSDKIVFKRTDSKWLAGKCRNFGIGYPINSEYTLFVDADDMLDGTYALQKIYDKLKKRPDVLLYSYSILRGNKKTRCHFQKFNQKSTNLANTPFNSSWSKAIKTSRLKTFLEGIMRGEDTYMWLQVLDEHPSLMQIDDSIYVYRIHGKNTVLSPQFKKDGQAFIVALRQLKQRMKNKYVVQSIERRIS